jgi:DNA (cytosine-5)-methyltransferase 1
MRIDKTIANKIRRLADGGAPRVLDLFAGCGGISLGFQSAGFEIAGAVEFDPEAAASHGANFHPGRPEHARAHDITQIEPAALAEELGLGPLATGIDVIVGGPPCQAYARVGRSKLREIHDHPDAFQLDPRAKLYLRYLKYVEDFQPLALVMENVPDVLNQAGRNIAEEVCETLEAMGYKTAYSLLNAAYYGVPQMRERMFLMAFRRELAVQQITFPSPTHWIELPPGYAGSRNVALKSLDLFAPDHRYIPAPKAHPDLKPAVTARNALEDLPTITEHLEGRMSRGARRFDTPIAYPGPAQKGSYAWQMRRWSGFAAPQEGVSDHVIRYLPRDWKLFARMNPGDQYPEAHAHARQLMLEEVERLKLVGRKVPKPGTKAWRDLEEEFIPPYDPGKFPNKWRKMEADAPARTLMAHLGKDSYSHIHYESRQARTISVREAARLQSFPDGFKFCGTMNPAFRQIGNAVPPLLANAVAVQMMKTLKQQAQRADSDEPARAAAAV